MGGMNIAERRVPQDGRANVRIKSRDIDLRLSTLAHHLRRDRWSCACWTRARSCSTRRASASTARTWTSTSRLIHSNNGVLLIAGPTGSGKSSTMYTMIRELNTEQVKLITLGRPGGVQHRRHQPGADQREDGPHVLQRPALHPAPGPRYRGRGRDPRRRDGRDRHARRHHRPPGAVHHPHLRLRCPPSTVCWTSAWSRTSSRPACAAS